MSQVVHDSIVHPIAPDSLLKAIQSFGRQRNWILFCKGVLASALALFVCTYAIILLDAGEWLSDQFRWFLSVCMYSVAGIIGWLSGLRTFIKKVPVVDLAREVERLHPHFSELLLTSVQLRDSNGRPRNGADCLVEAIERQTLRELSFVDVSQLAPWSVLRSRTLILAILLLLFAGLAGIPSLRFPTRIVRALVPFVELETPTPWVLEIKYPSDRETEMPADQTLRFELIARSLHGQWVAPDEAFLEIEELDLGNTRTRGEIQKIRMEREISDADLYIAKAPIGRNRIRYRFRFDKAKTPYRFVTPLKRPEVEQFHWEVQPPSYMDQAIQYYSSNDGDLKVLRNSRVRLAIQATEPLRNAFIVLEDAITGRSDKLPLTKMNQESTAGWIGLGNERWETSLPAQTSGRFQVHLESMKSFQNEPIRNTFSRWQQLTVQDDPSPLVQWRVLEDTEWHEPPIASDLWIVSEESCVRLPIAVVDNALSDEARMEMSINQGPWTVIAEPRDIEFDRTQEPELDGTFRTHLTWQWDLMKHRIETDDIISIRCSVVDKAENAAQSIELRFGVAKKGLTENRHISFPGRVELLIALQKMNERLTEASARVRPHIETLHVLRPEETDSERFDKTIEWLTETEQQFASIQNIASRLMPILSDCRDQSEVELLMRLLSKIRRHSMAFLHSGVETAKLFSQGVQSVPEKTARFHFGLLKETVGIFDEAREDVTSAFELYREIIGFEFQSCLSKDMQILKGKISGLTLQIDETERSQRSLDVTLKNWESMSRFYDRWIAFLDPVTREGLQRWHQYVEGLRKELHDLQNRDALNTQVWRSKIGQVSHNLENFGGIDQYTGSLSKPMEQFDQELLRRAGNSSAVSRFFSSLNAQQIEQFAAMPLSTEQAMGLQSIIRLSEQLVTERLTQIQDRKEMHQLRSYQDPTFVSDMGLAWRAWNEVYRKWKENLPDSGYHSDDLVSILAALQLLEAVHEFQQSKLPLVALQKPERYDYTSTDIHRSHYRIWEIFPSRLESSCRWLRDANVRPDICEQIHSMLWSDTRQRAQQKLATRRDSKNQDFVSAASEIDELLQTYTVLEALLQPTADEARALLSRLAPTISEIARRAARESRILEESTDAIRRDLESQSPTVASEIEIPRRETNKTASDLRDALIEQASRMNLLDDQQRMLAQSSDLAIESLNHLLENMNRSIDQTLKSIESESRSSHGEKIDAIEEALKSESLATKAFENIAEHFDPSNGYGRETTPGFGSPLLKSGDTDQPHPQSSYDRDLKKLYDRANQLSQTKQRSPEETLKQLEEELHRNELMQSELSRIAKDSVSNAKSELRNASALEKELSLELENSDIELSWDKKLQIDKLRWLSDEVEKLIARRLDKSAQMSQRANELETQQELQQLASQLLHATKSIRDLSEQSTSDSLQSSLVEFLDALNEAHLLGQQLQSAISQQVGIPKERDEPRRLQRFSEAKNAQSSIRNEFLQLSQQMLKAATEDWSRIKKREEKIDGDLETLQQALKVSAADESRSALDSKLRDLLLSNDVLLKQRSGTRAELDQVQSFLERINERSEKIANQERADLNKPNPYSALALEQLQQADEHLVELLNGSEELHRQLEPRAARPSPDVTANAASRQSQIKQEIERISQDLERSARHEKRLGNKNGSDRLEQSSKDIRTTAANALTDAERQLANDAEKARDAEQSFLNARKADSTVPELSRPEIGGSNQSLLQSQKELEQHAQNLESISGPEGHSSTDRPSSPAGKSADTKSHDATQTDASNQSTGSSDGKVSSSRVASAGRPAGNREAQIRTAVDMAQLLDQLDRAVYTPIAPAETMDSNEGRSSEARQNNRSVDPQESRGEKRNPANALQAQLQLSSQRLASEMSQQRAQQRDRNPVGQTHVREKQSASSSTGLSFSGETALTAEEYFLNDESAEHLRDWGKLRRQSAEDVLEGKREIFDPEYDEAIQAYYRILGESRRQARKP